MALEPAYHIYNKKAGVSMIDTISVADKATMEAMKLCTDDIYNILIKNKSDIKRYGVRISKHEHDPYKKVEYIYDAVGMTPAHMNYSTGQFDYGSWANIWFVKDNIPVVLNDDGTVRYALNPDNYEYKNNGSYSDITDELFTGNCMSKIPQIWTHYSEDDDYIYVIVSEYKYDDSYYAFAHMNAKGGIVNDIYLSMFDSSLDNGKIVSRPNKVPVQDFTHDQYVTAAKLNGNRWNIRSWAQRQLINSLLLIMGKSTNTQDVFGNGDCNSYSYDDHEMAYKYNIITPGTLIKKGQFYGSSDSVSAVKIFHIENWWGAQWETLNGLVIENGVVKAKMAGDYSDLNSFDSTRLSFKFQDERSGNSISSVTADKYGMIPYASTIYTGNAYDYSDAVYYYAYELGYTLVGGASWDNLNAGAFAFAFRPEGFYSWHLNAGLSLI